MVPQIRIPPLPQFEGKHEEDTEHFLRTVEDIFKITNTSLEKGHDFMPIMLKKKCIHMVDNKHGRQRVGSNQKGV